MTFQLGNVVIHKATGKRCVVIGITTEGKVEVTTQDDQYRCYIEEELVLSQRQS